MVIMSNIYVNYIYVVCIFKLQMFIWNVDLFVELDILFLKFSKIFSRPHVDFW